MRTLLSMMLGGAAIMLVSSENLLSAPSEPSAMLVFSADAPVEVFGTTGPSPGDETPLIIEREKDGLFYINARVNGVPVRFLFDTGASQTVLTAADARRIGIHRTGKRSGMLITASGRIATTSAHIERIEVANQRISDSEAMIIGDALPVSLLGQNVLARMNGVTVHRDTLRFH